MRKRAARVATPPPPPQNSPPEADETRGRNKNAPYYLSSLQKTQRTQPCCSGTKQCKASHLHTPVPSMLQITTVDKIESVQNNTICGSTGTHPVPTRAEARQGEEATRAASSPPRSEKPKDQRFPCSRTASQIKNTKNLLLGLSAKAEWHRRDSSCRPLKPSNHGLSPPSWISHRFFTPRFSSNFFSHAYFLFTVCSYAQY